MASYKLSTAYTRMFKMIDSADHFSKKTGLTCTVNISKAGAAFGAAGGTVTEVASGWYKIVLTTTDTNTLGDLAYYITATGADDTDFVDQVVAIDALDAVRYGLSALPNAAAAASGGLIINGSNAGTVTLAALTVTAATTLTGNVALAAGLTITQSSSNAAGLSITGNGSGAGILSTGGATGIGISAVGGGTSGSGIKAVGSAGNAIALEIAGQGSAAGMSVTGGATGSALKLVGGGTSGDGLTVTTTSGHGLNIAATGTSKHGITSTGGNGGTSDGMALVAGTGGVDLRANRTGNLTGTVATLTTYTGNTPQTGDAYAVVNDASFGNSKLVRSTTPANTLDVAATGEAGLDFNNVKDASAGHTLTNITVPVVTTVSGNVNGSTASIGANGLDAAALATDAVTEIVTAMFARAFSAAYNSLTFDQIQKLQIAVLVGLASGLDTGAIAFRKLDNSGDAVTATADASGNRSVVTLTP